MNKILCPSMMCADYGSLKQEVLNLDAAGADIFHCDIMDGSFVPNMAMGLMDIRTIKKYTDKPVDVHLMIEQPSQKIDWFIDAGADIIYIHPESERYVTKTLSYIHAKGKKAGIAIDPDTSIFTIEEMLPACDYVMVMTVNPGFAGQKFIESVKEKIKKLNEQKEKYKFKIIIDGSCSPERIQELSEIGADGFILGTSALFGKDRAYRDIIQELRAESKKEVNSCQKSYG